MTFGSRPIRLGTCIPLLIVLSGCTEIDPLTRHYVWHPSNVNTFNVAAMAARPADLVRGRGKTGHRNAAGETVAAEKILAGKYGAQAPGGGL